MYLPCQGPDSTHWISAIVWHSLCSSTFMTTKQLDAAGFRELIFDYEKEEDWKYKGPLPAIIDFYADWCGPCKAVAPVLEELAIEFAEKLIIYKVDTDKEEELSTLFHIQSIPTLLFIPMEGTPMIQKGALPKNMLQKVINERLMVSEEIPDAERPSATAEK